MGTKYKADYTMGDLAPATKKGEKKPSPRSSVNVAADQPAAVYGGTQGRKGQKLPRINMGFSSDIHDYIRDESMRRGMSMSAFVNFIVREYMNSSNGYIR